MLIGLPSVLGPDLLSTLRAMGHGDEIALVDGNYPAQEHGRRVVRADGHGIIALLDAVLQVMPVDDFVAEAIFRSAVRGDAGLLDPIHRDMLRVCGDRAPGFRVVPLVGAAFYDRVKAAYAVVATSEPQLYANIILRKGVIRPAEKDAS